MREEHPVIARVEVRDGAIAIVNDYFDRKPEASTGWCHFPGAADAPETKWDWTWPLGDIVTSRGAGRPPHRAFSGVPQHGRVALR